MPLRQSEANFNLNLISWNIARRDDAWRRLLDTDADVALLQEATAPPSDVAAKILVDGEPWRTEGADANRPWRAAVVQLSNRVRTTWYRPSPFGQAGDANLGVSRRGTLAAAEVAGADGTSYTVVSMYGLWERPHLSTRSSWIYADASVHRLISDLAVFVGQQDGHRVLAAGDLNILHGYGENGSVYWGARYATVFERMRTMGIPFVGPQAPCGRCAEPWPTELPRESANVPTYYTTRMTPAQACRQLDFVFASTGLVPRLFVYALNEPDDWGPSDHCRLRIELR
jgi:Endonuclease/Exonuclease/phosphatase family